MKDSLFVVFFVGLLVTGSVYAQTIHTNISGDFKTLATSTNANATTSYYAPPPPPTMVPREPFIQPVTSTTNFSPANQPAETAQTTGVIQNQEPHIPPDASAANYFTPPSGLGTVQTQETFIEPNTSAPRILIAEPAHRAPPAPPQKTTPPVPNIPHGATTGERIQDVGTSLRQLERETKRIDAKIRTTVSREVDNAVNQASRETLRGTGPEPTRSFNVAEREKIIAKLKLEIQEKQNKLSESARETVTSRSIDHNNFGPILKSSLEEIGILIEAETGVRVDLSPSARAITSVVADTTEQLETARKELLSRDGLDLYNDNDYDGVSNYDEKYIYKTDPQNAFTAGSSLTDGERILLGLDLYATTTERIPVESPQVSGTVIEHVFEVHSITVRLEPTTSSTDGLQAEPQAVKEVTSFSGRALPNSFVTIYIYSTPVVVTIKTDIHGAWRYELDSELEDGTHELHLAVVDPGGRILAKSPVIPFIKTAEAVEFTPLLPTANGPDPIDTLQNYLLIIGGLVFISFIIGVLLLLGKKRESVSSPGVQ